MSTKKKKKLDGCSVKKWLLLFSGLDSRIRKNLTVGVELPTHATVNLIIILFSEALLVRLGMFNSQW